MAEDTIIVDIISNIDEITMRLDMVGTQAQQTVGSKRLDLALPGINRELRLILGQIPGMREAMRAYFALKRIERGAAYLAIGEKVPAMLTAIATLIILVNYIMDWQKNMERRQKELEMVVRRGRGLTHDQYVDLMDEWQSYFRSSPG